jgi:tol-pal system-associated acyl-CoA thioesterase
MPAFWLPVRVYLEDTDAQGVVYNASYFRFFERARTDWLNERGINHRASEADHGIRFVLASIEARFLAPGILGEMLAVSAEMSALRGARIEFGQQVRRGSHCGEVLAEAGATVACIDRESGRPRRWPEDILKDLSG